MSFRWMSEHGRYTVSLDAGLLNDGCFIRNHMLGNGYDWEKAAVAFAEKQGMDSGGKFCFDCEADTFCMYSSSKKMLKEFAISSDQVPGANIFYLKTVQSVFGAAKAEQAHCLIAEHHFFRKYKYNF